MAEVVPSDRELEILKALWRLGEASVRQVHEALTDRGELAFNTVQTQLRIMETKGLVKHRAEGRTFLYKPRYSRERAATRFLKKVFDGALDQLVLTMLRADDVSPEEMQRLEALIETARRDKKGSSQKRS